jgi:hypothetical protein
MTSYFLLLMFIMFLVITFLPMKTLFMMYLTRRFYRGQFYHKKRVRNNREALLIEYSNFIEDNKHLLPKTSNVNNLEEKWENIYGRSMSFKVFQ